MAKARSEMDLVEILESGFNRTAAWVWDSGADPEDDVEYFSDLWCSLGAHPEDVYSEQAGMLCT